MFTKKHDGHYLFLDAPVRLSAQEMGRACGLAASYTRTSTDSDSSLLTMRIPKSDIAQP